MSTSISTGSQLATTGAQKTSGSVLVRPAPFASQHPGRGAQPVVARAVASMEPATLTRDAAGTRDAGDTRPTEAALRAALTTDICQEHVEPVPLRVSGRIPDWLDGVLLKNGPGTFKDKQHLFDGYGMIAKFVIANGEVTVSNRFVESNSWKAFRDTGRPRFGEFGTPLPSLTKSLWNIVVQATGLGQGFTDNSNVNVMPTPDGKSAVSLTELATGSYVLDMDTLATRGPIRYRDKVAGAMTTAHPSVQPDGSLINLTADFGGHYTVFRTHIGSDVREIVAELPLRKATFPAPSWIHDFPCTPNYMVLPECPISFDVKSLTLGGTTEYVVMNWKPEAGTRLTIVPLDGDKARIKTFEMPSWFTFHYVNAFESEDGSELSFDFGMMDHPGQLNNLRLADMRRGEKPIVAAPLTRLTVPLKGGSDVKVTPLIKDDSAYFAVELPRVNPLVKGQRYQYAYAGTAQLPTTLVNALSKFDLKAGICKSWFEAGAIPTEPLMIPRPGSTAEDDGVVLSVVTGADGCSFLLVLDAGTFEEVARAHTDWAIPYQFHGNWYSNAAV